MRHLLSARSLWMLVAVLLGGSQITSDVNRLADRSPEIVVTRRIVGTEVHVRRRYSREDHYVNITFPTLPEQLGFKLPTKIEVPRDLWLQARRGGALRLSIGHGFFGVPWYRDIAIIASPAAPAR